MMLLENFLDKFLQYGVKHINSGSPTQEFVDLFDYAQRVKAYITLRKHLENQVLNIIDQVDEGPKPSLDEIHKFSAEAHHLIDDFRNKWPQLSQYDETLVRLETRATFEIGWGWYGIDVDEKEDKLKDVLDSEDTEKNDS